MRKFLWFRFFLRVKTAYRDIRFAFSSFVACQVIGQ